MLGSAEKKEKKVPDFQISDSSGRNAGGILTPTQNMPTKSIANRRRTRFQTSSEYVAEQEQVVSLVDPKAPRKLRKTCPIQEMVILLDYKNAVHEALTDVWNLFATNSASNNDIRQICSELSCCTDREFVASLQCCVDLVQIENTVLALDAKLYLDILRSALTTHSRDSLGFMKHETKLMINRVAGIFTHASDGFMESFSGFLQGLRDEIDSFDNLLTHCY